MKKLIFACMGVAVIFASSCKKDGFHESKELVSGGASGVDTLVGTISHDTTVVRTTYLKGIVYVAPGVTLRINAGVTIKGSAGSVAPDTVNLANNKGTLVIQKGAKIIANGTPTSPIVWTSTKPAGSRHFGDWGGLVLLGNATIHTATGATTNTFEALPSSDPRNSYGGTNDADNSGSVTYNRFEFGGGVVLKPNQEVNGVTFCGVGNGTVFNHVEVSNSGDDGFEWFGGSVNCDHLLDFSPKDDEYDFDEGYHGNLQFIIAYRLNINDNSGSHGIESDNDASGTAVGPHTLPFIANATFIGPADTASATGDGNHNYYDGEIFFRRNSRLRLVNSLIIAQAQPWAVVSTPTTKPLVAKNASLSDSVLIAYNIFQTNSAHPIVSSSIEGNPAVVTDDAATLGKLAGLNNTALGAFGDFKLDGALKPLPGSPALSGGVNLAALGLTQFVGTTQRGAVLSTDAWTTTGTWLSTSTN
ncbi:hypothetical protein Q4E93_07375 [Flavitalea sp. BT771]|uniref:hypothetical protein n=1 Tax=Flavitalea sp. BT771 TaxID=3063329 RepID=UPI0026E4543A|nr:hypothetical protein [Flavitalea sp. BT771]MDO6430400.1 hypothetical protein [Flavitalea sp. BT771]MDV6219460.1 hypothetical protein [Flavitalea sp. BT771]